MALPRTVDLDKFLRVAITALQQNPDLLKQDRNSLYAAVMTAAQLGLLPDYQLGECYFIPRKGKVYCDPGYRGLIKLARQGDIGHVEAELIYERDRVEYLLGDNSRLTIDVNWRDRGELIGGYALAKYRDGAICARHVMMREEIDAIRARSQNATGPAWTNDYTEMARKTLVRRLSKYLPLSVDAQRAFSVSELHDELNRPSQIIEGTVVADDDEPTEAQPEPKPKAKPPARTATETKQKPAKTQLDAFGPSGQPEAERRPAASTDSGRPDLNVDPDTGEILGGDDQYFGDEDGTPPAP
jgi:recombination protein RecT